MMEKAGKEMEEVMIFVQSKWEEKEKNYQNKLLKIELRKGVY
jgi:hypothetical protein